VTADYTAPIGEGGNLVLHADSAWRSSYFGDPSLSRYTLIKGYTLTNASLGYRSDENWEISIFARNLFDSDYLQNLTIQAVDVENNLLLVKGAVPGPKGALILVRTAAKKKGGAK
jgi:iron complex outermembrane receptor protein